MRRIIDKRRKEKFLMDDLYLNGQARICGWQATLVYVSLCRHANKDQESFPSIKLLSEELAVSRPTIIKGLERLELANIIKIEKVRNKKGVWKNNVYVLQDKSVWEKIKPIENKRGSKTPRINGKFSTQVNDTDTATQVRNNTNPSPQEYKPKSVTIQTQVNDTDTKETHRRKHIEGNTSKGIAKQSFAGKEKSSSLEKEVAELIKMFEPINPTTYRLYGMTTQRKAIKRMLKKFGYQKLEQIIKFLPKVVGREYAPTITTPAQLENKMAQLVAYTQKEFRNKSKSKFVKV